MKKKAATETTIEATDEVMPELSKGKRIATMVVNVLLVLAIVLAAVCTYTSYVSTSGNGVPSIFGIRILSIQTESMYPTLTPGDMIFDKAVQDAGELEIGDIITYWTVIDGERVLNTHRIIQIYDGGGYLIFETQGDNNTAADPLTVHESEIVGKYEGVKVPGLGKVFDYLQTSTGFLIVVVIPVAIFFLFHLIQFFRVLFEYNNVKNKLLYEMERGKTEDLVEDEKKRQDEIRQKERERLEAELREKLRKEILAANAAGASDPVNPPEASAEDEAKRLEAERAAKEAEERAKAEEEQKAAEQAAKEAEERAKAEEERKAAERAAMEAEIRAQILAEMEAKAKADAGNEAAPEET